MPKYKNPLTDEELDTDAPDAGNGPSEAAQAIAPDKRDLVNKFLGLKTSVTPDASSDQSDSSDETVQDIDMSKPVAPQLEKGKESDDSEDEEPETREPAGKEDKIETSQAAAAPAEPSKVDQYQQLLKQIQEANNPQRMRDAQQISNQMALNANLSNAFTTMAEAGGRRELNRSGIQAMQQQAQMPIQSELMNRQQALQGLTTQEQLAKYKQALETTNPDSQRSKLARDTYKEFTGKTLPDSVSEADVENKLGHVEKWEQFKAQRENQLLMRQALMGQTKTKAEAAVASRVGTQLLGARTPGAQLQEADAYNTQKIEAIRQKYGDLNKIPVNMLPVVIGEVAKVAKGGVPDKQELERMMPNSVQTWIANNSGKVLNESQAGKARGFLQQYFDYAHDIQTNARKNITERYGRILESNKDKMAPEDYKSYHDQYMGRFGVPAESTQTAQGSQGTQSSGQRTVVKKGYNSKTNQTQLIYSDGTKEIVPGRQ